MQHLCSSLRGQARVDEQDFEAGALVQAGFPGFAHRRLALLVLYTMYIMLTNAIDFQLENHPAYRIRNETVGTDGSAKEPPNAISPSPCKTHSSLRNRRSEPFAPEKRTQLP